MIIKIQWQCLVLAVVSIACVTFADLFPAREGNWWHFRYTIAFGSLAGAKVDSGTVQWRIFQILPGNNTYWIKIQQERDLIRSKTNILVLPTNTDSLFNPPRITIDTLTLTGHYLNAGLVLDNDSCFSLLHAPYCNAAQCSLRTQQMMYDGKTIVGYIVDPVFCRSKGVLSANCIGPQRFTQADGIGPVAFESSLSPCIMDVARNEQWTLIDHHASNRWLEPDTVIAGTSITLTLSTLEYACVPDSFVKNVAMDSKGITFVYRPVYSPVKDCLALYGTTSTIGYQLMAPAAGKYPVFIESQPSCAPLCKMASTIECIDTLVVKGSAAIKRQPGHFVNGATPSVRKNNGSLVIYNAEYLNGGAVRLLDASGRLLDRAFIVEGKAVFNAEKLLTGKIVFIAIENGTALKYCLP
jgi:hypothetical protein